MSEREGRGADLVEAVRRGATSLGLRGKRVLVAVSGGPDSVALLLALRELGPAMEVELAAATIDHQLRRGSAADARYVARLCRRLGVACHCLRVDVRGAGGVEAAARRARYGALQTLAVRERFQAIATAHTLEDQVETVLLRLARGAGLRGARGILPRRGLVVRPMLEVSRVQIASFLAARRVRPRRDPTNDSPAFARNRVRALVLPAIERALGGSALEAIARFSRTAAVENRFLAGLARARARRILEPGRAAGDAQALALLAPALRRRVLSLAAQRAGIPLNSAHIEALEAALCAGGPRTVTLPDGLEWRVEYGRFSFGAPRDPVARPFCHAIPGEGQYVFEEAEVEVLRRNPNDQRCRGELRLDADAIRFPLVLRSRRPGDRYTPRGAGGKKLKSLLIDAKIPRADRDRLPLLCDASGTILHVPGLRPSQAASDGESASHQLAVWVRPASSAANGGQLQRVSMVLRSPSEGRGRRSARRITPGLRGPK